MCPSKKESFNFYLKYFLIFFQKTNDILQMINLQSVRKKNESIKLYSKKKKKKYRFENISFPIYRQNFFL